MPVRLAEPDVPAYTKLKTICPGYVIPYEYANQSAIKMLVKHAHATCKLYG